MEELKSSIEQKPNPVLNANPLSQLTFGYMFPIFVRTLKKDLTEDDIFAPLESHKSSLIGEKLERMWNKERLKKGKFILHKALFRTFWFTFVFTGLVKLFGALLLVLAVPLSTYNLISHFGQEKSEDNQNQVYIYAGVLISVYLLDTFTFHPCMMAAMHFGMKLRVALSSLIYRKALRLSKSSLSQTTVGQIVNLLSNDVNKLDQGMMVVHFAWIAPIQTAVGIYLLYTHIDISAFFGMAFLLCFVPLQIFIGKRTSILRLKTALRTDERVRIMSEIINGIQVIKMYCWEKPFAKLIALARRKEMNAIRSRAYLFGIVFSLESFVARTSIAISILGYVLLSNALTPETVFTITAIYNVLRTPITLFFSLSITSIAEINTSFNRIQQFMLYSEVEHEMKEKQYLNGDNSLNGSGKYSSLKEKNSLVVKPKILLKNVSARWIEDMSENTIEDININISSNSLLAIIGPVGSGKSSIINTLLGELITTGGNMEIQGKMSYASQESWLFSGSVRQNILFGESYDKDRYEAVVKVCSLTSDFDLFPYGDKTLIGERGKTLSGGQKARVNLARSIYRQADIYLLDDPLSAVDVNVGKHLYDECIKKFLSDKICILVTHQLQYLRNADHIIIMKEGTIQQQGNYNELQKRGLNFGKLLQEFDTETEDTKVNKPKSRQNSEMTNESDEVDEEEDDAPIAEKEQRSIGRVNIRAYGKYIRAGGSIFSILLMFTTLVSAQVLAYGSDYFMKYWVNLEQQNGENSTENVANYENESFSRNDVIYTFSGLTLATVIFGIGHCIYFLVFFTYSSVNLHNNTFDKLIQAKMNFFNNNTSGRILNRFAKDLGTMDEYIPPVMYDLFTSASQLVAVFVLSFIIEPLLVVPSFVLLLVFFGFRMLYIKTSLCVKRLEGTTKSPVFNYMTTSVHGLSTIRANNAEKLLISEFDHLQDRHSATWYLFISSNRCFGMWGDFICITFIGSAMFILIAFNKGIYGGDIGLIITQYFGLLGSLQWGMRQWSELENQMTSVERVLEYAKLDCDPERPKLTNLPENWPEKGKVEFRNVKLRYNVSDPEVLRDVSFTVESRQKVGVVGRTGAGKSSTISALFQLYEMEGQIYIDDVDTTTVPLDLVRSKISIIPQEPVLFSGTMRKNLDPFDEYSDNILWDALEQVELKETVADFHAGLNTSVTEGGTNFSVGQRQLVCLARALVRNNKILVLDEATANVDPYTDALIQRTIRDKFSECTVLTIAHRLHTVMDSDKILVMKDGKVSEFDEPYTLLQNHEGVFHNLVQMTGVNTAKTLEQNAFEHFKNRQKNRKDVTDT